MKILEIDTHKKKVCFLYCSCFGNSHYACVASNKGGDYLDQKCVYIYSSTNQKIVTRLEITVVFTC